MRFLVEEILAVVVVGGGDGRRRRSGEEDDMMTWLDETLAEVLSWRSDIFAICITVQPNPTVAFVSSKWQNHFALSERLLGA